MDELSGFEEAYRNNLAAEINYREESVGACQRCFGMTHLLQGQKITHNHTDVIVLDEPRQPEYISTSSILNAPLEAILSTPLPLRPDPKDEDHSNQMMEA